MKKFTHNHINHSRRRTGLTDVAVVLFTLIFFVGCTGRHHTVPDTAITEPFDSLFSSLFDDDTPGAIVIVSHNDTIVYDRGFGLATLDTELPITDSTIFTVSSASKLLTAAAIMKLVEEGKICLDDSLTKFFPEFANEFFNKITVKNLLSHTSGLPDLRPRNEDEWDDYLDTHHSIFSYNPDYRLFGTETEHMMIFQHLTSVAYPPGTHYDKTDLSYVLLAPIVERVTGETYDTWMQENIFNPLGMHETAYYEAIAEHPLLAHGYTRADRTKEPVTYRSEDQEWDEYDYAEAEFFLTKADRGACSSAREYIKFVQALFNGEIINQESIDELCDSIIPIPGLPYTYYGLGIALRDEPGYPRRAYHLNQNGGFSGIHATYPDQDLHYIIFSNRNDWDQRKVSLQLDSIFRAKGWI